MSGEPMIQPRRAVHAASLAISAAFGGAVASLLAARLGAGAATIGSIWTVTGLATVLGAWPLLIAGAVSASRYGAVVMAGSGVRLLATLAVGLAMSLGAASRSGSGEPLAFWMGVLVAAAAVIIGDSAAAVATLRGASGAGAEAADGAGRSERAGAVGRSSRAAESPVERA